MTDAASERRRTPRISVKAHRLLVARQVKVRVVDISAGGVLVASPVVPSTRSNLRVALGPGQFDAAVEMCHQTQVSGDKGVEFRAGGMFIEMSAVSRTALERFLAKAATHD
jgi:hypothetical protein